MTKVGNQSLGAGWRRLNKTDSAAPARGLPSVPRMFYPGRMATLSPLPAADPLFPAEAGAAAVARGVARLLYRHDLVAVAEVALGNGRRADLMAVDSHGAIVIVEIKVSRADLLGDGKWGDYLPYCDRFFWAVPAGFDLAPFSGAALGPEVSGLIVADRYDAAIVREAPLRPMAPARRRSETLRLARRAARRLLELADPDAASSV